jgi:hypothetical protein
MAGVLLGLGRFALSKWGFLATTVGGVVADQKFNDGAASKKVIETVADAGAKVAGDTIGITSDKIKEQISEAFNGEGGEFVKENWGKLLTGALAVGLFTMPSMRSTGLLIGLGLAAYMAYKHFAKDGFNMAAADAAPAPTASARTTAEMDPVTGKPKKNPLDLSGVDPNNGVMQSARDDAQRLAREQRQAQLQPPELER